MAILPPPSTAAEVERLSAALRTRGGLFQVDGKHKFAHLTLYMARFANSNIDSTVAEAAKFAERHNACALDHTGFHLTQGNYYEVSYARSEGVLKLHQGASDSLLPLRYSPGRPWIEDYFAPYSKRQREEAERTGYDLAGDLHRPHITITRFAEPPARALPSPEVDLSFSATTIGLFRADDLGAITEAIGLWSLGA
ncbi:hypothetical protein DMB66_46655 [Actinoplanes sp. ATCC 53533]|uniref:hypothetical protein n=1 Tax=Actinoplanes sp. ATCC 53533 TaxID=1288362 RepID=UPI000F7957A7|nr:hypothetical protein [Actinoplanes sp. ATCC 53533]RSM48349.1 hypothetical protein DMB66_46655 [Actinoplanes sp. ATCC 53533]